MLIDGRELDGEHLASDDCVVGSGPAGSIVADELAKAGRRVIVVEAGGVDRQGRGADLQATIRDTGYPYPVHRYRRCGVGGSAPWWFIQAPHGAETLRLRELDRSDFAPRPWVGLRGWPVNSEDLEPHYRSARRTFGIPEPLVDEWGCWDTELRRSPVTMEGSDVEVKPFDLASRERFLELYTRRLTRSPNVRVIHSAPVVELTSDSTDQAVARASCAPTDSTRFDITAERFVLAGGGIENARLLLASRSRWADGLGNHNDLVGRYFMEHPRCIVAFAIPGPGSALDDPRTYDIHDHRAHPVQRHFALTRESQERLGTGNHNFVLTPNAWSPRTVSLLEGWDLDQLRSRAARMKETVQRPGTELRAAGTREVAAAAAYPWQVARLRMKARSRIRASRRGHRTPVLAVEATSELMPDPSSRLTLRPHAAESPLPPADLHLRIGNEHWSGLYRAVELLALAMQRAGADVEIVPPTSDGDPPWVAGGAHHLGTTRMSSSPGEGVVDRNAKIHGMANVYIAGSSIFPTGGGINPTLTIIAFAHRLADHLVRRS